MLRNRQIGTRLTRILLCTVAVLAVAVSIPTPARSQSADKSSAQPYIGVAFDPAPRGESGVLVRQVTPNSPAAQGGLAPGDRIIKIGDENVADPARFMQIITGKKPGEQIKLRTSRAGQEMDVSITLGERPRTGPGAPGAPPPSGLRGMAFLGVSTVPMTKELQQRLATTVDQGVVITEVVPNSPAASAGFKVNDVIASVNDKAITHPDQLREAVQKAGAGNEITVQITRGSEKQTVKAKLKEGSPFGGFGAWTAERPPMMEGDMGNVVRRMRELERRVEELEKRVRELEKK